MNSNKWVRQTHRWLSTAFTVTVIDIVAVAQKMYTDRLGPPTGAKGGPRREKNRVS